jgi:hypothetical protein
MYMDNLFLERQAAEWKSRGTVRLTNKLRVGRVIVPVALGTWHW